MMKVEKIDLCGDFSCEEADVIISDGQFHILCFCHPCMLTLNQEITEPLSLLDAKNVMRSFEKMYKVEKIKDRYYAYNFIGKLIDKKAGIVTVGGIKFDLGSVPQDIDEDEFIEFSCGRIDCNL